MYELPCLEKSKKSCRLKYLFTVEKLKVNAGTGAKGHEQNQTKPAMNKFSLDIIRLLTIRISKHRNSIPR